MTRFYQIKNNRATGNFTDAEERPSRDWVPASTPPAPGQRYAGFALGFAPETQNPDSAKIESARLEALYQAAKAHESASCDGNKVSLITTIEAICLATQRAPPPKSAAARSWLDTLWADWRQRGETGVADIDFSAHGPCPYSYVEIRTEAMG